MTQGTATQSPEARGAPDDGAGFLLGDVAKALQSLTCCSTTDGAEGRRNPRSPTTVSPVLEGAREQMSRMCLAMEEHNRNARMPAKPKSTGHWRSTVGGAIGSEAARLRHLRSGHSSFNASSKSLDESTASFNTTFTSMPTSLDGQLSASATPCAGSVEFAESLSPRLSPSSKSCKDATPRSAGTPGSAGSSRLHL
mmetsp:Transcript_5414/g.10571  ORF Transcript_5414/g.10571 Transcript_5414/m.10571 type:complete len:196 (+) Transcript_5414:195-782(+)